VTGEQLVRELEARCVDVSGWRLVSVAPEPGKKGWPVVYVVLNNVRIGPGGSKKYQNFGRQLEEHGGIWVEEVDGFVDTVFDSLDELAEHLMMLSSPAVLGCPLPPLREHPNCGG
jgi:hypothetical protein